MERQILSIYKDLYRSRNLSEIEKYVITQIRYGNEKFEHYTMHPKKLSDFCDCYFDESEIKICYDKLLAYGIIKSEDTKVELEGREPFKSHYDTIDEKKLKSIL